MRLICLKLDAKDLVPVKLLFALVAFLLSTPVYAAIVTGVEFVGHERVPNSTLETTVKIKSGYQLDPKMISDDIKALYALGHFEDIVVKEEPSALGVKIIFVVTERPFITEVGFSGNKKIKSDELMEKVKVRTYRPLDGVELTASVEAIRDAYEKKGYYLAQVDYHLESKTDKETKLIFDIKENAGVVVREVRFIGNKVFSDRVLRRNIATRRKGLFSFLTGSGKFSEDMLQEDIMRLTFFYLNHGYLKVKVSKPTLTISPDKRYIFVIFSIKEGERYKIGNVGIEGDILTTAPELMSMLKTKSGDIYSQMTIEADIMRLTEFYGDQSYAYANVYPDIIPDDEKLTADIKFYISKGNKVRINRINISGNSVTRDKVIRRELLVMENDLYNETFIRKSRENLMRLGYFEDVNFATPRAGEDDNTVDLDITVKERPTGSFNVSVGFSTFENFIFAGSIQKENFFGYGISGQASAQISGKRQYFFLTGRDPYFLDTNMIFGASLYHTNYMYEDFSRKAFGGDLTFGRRFFEKYSAEIGYKIEDVSVGSFSSIVPQFFRKDSKGLTSAVTFNVKRDDRDDRIFAKDGTLNVFYGEVASREIGSDNQYLRLVYQSAFYQPVWKKKLLFRTLGKIGWMRGLHGDTLPLFERFFMGGPYDLRGYYPNSVGPSLRIPGSATSGDGRFTYGGNKQLLFISELEYLLHERAGISLVAFFDAGNAFAEDQNYSFNLRKDYGFGLRWNSPMGPLRFEFGIPLDRRRGDDAWQFNFTMGRQF